MEELRQRRLDARLSQAEMARRVGCSRAYICMIEYGRSHPSEDMRERIEQAFKGKWSTKTQQRTWNRRPMPEDERAELHEIWVRRGYGEDRKGR